MKIKLSGELMFVTYLENGKPIRNEAFVDGISKGPFKPITKKQLYNKIIGFKSNQNIL